MLGSKLLSLVAFMNPLLPHKDTCAEACQIALVLKKDSDQFLGRWMHNLEVWQHLNHCLRRDTLKGVFTTVLSEYVSAFKHYGLCT